MMGNFFLTFKLLCCIINFVVINEVVLCNGSTYDSDSYCLGSNPSTTAICPYSLAVRTLPSHGRIRGSIPLKGANIKRLKVFKAFFCFFN